MKNARRIVLALSAAAALSVTACSAPAQQPSGQNAAAFKKYSEAELTALLEQAKDSEGKALTVMPAAELKKGLELTKSMAASTKVTPAECASSNVTGGLQALSGATAAAATSAPDATGVPLETVSLVSGLSEDALTGDVDKMKEQAEKCKAVTIEVAGQKVEAGFEPIEISSETPGAVAIKSTTKASGAESTQVIVAAVKGGVAVSSVYVSTGSAEADAKKAVATLDSVAALIK
ncbi:hypothetical protein BIU82_12845 [Arthrobacter sp. SW1]|uniref:hypothetical protein n=1 Tax=Arthrobacter sp. SW1 TaxID=1920889 RepID=UPI000877B674|nr:hypothetical protein [Arthrobacter sp. SW1]OFI36643.1 hypothetical protein BIU82_12845 [Arthrobacter sp. SW1]